MGTSRLARAFVGVAVALTAVSSFVAAAYAQPRWISHLDASWIREIVHRDGRLYLATGGGLVIYDIAAGSFSRYTNVDGLPSNDLSCLDFAPDGSLYVGTRDIGIVRLTVSGSGLGVVKRFNQQIDGLADNDVKSLAVWNDDVVYGSSGGAGTIVNDFPAALYRDIEGMPSNLVRDVQPLADFTWMATDSGVVLLDEFGLLTIPAGGPAETWVVGSDGTLTYVGAGDGLWSYETAGGTWTQIGALSGRVIHSIHFDGQTLRAGGTRNLWTRSGSSWIMTRLNDVYGRYSLGLGAVQVTGLVAVPGGDVYMGTGNTNALRGTNLIRYDGVDLVDIAPEAPGANLVDRLSVDIDGSVWAAFRDYWVGKLETDGSWVNYNPTIAASDSLSSAYNTTCFADADGYKWFSTLYTIGSPGPLDRLDDGLDNDYANDSWQRVTVGSGGGDGLGSGRLQNAVLDPAGNRWFLSDAGEIASGWEGIHILSRDQSEWLQIKTTTLGAALARGDVVDVAFTNAFAYVALREWGVQRFATGGYDWTALSSLSTSEWFNLWPVPDATTKVTSVAATDDGKVWIGTNDGLYRIDTADSFKERRYGQFSGFTAGLLSIDVQDLLVDHGGDIWVATTAGLNRVSGQDEEIVDAWSTPAEYQRTLSQAQYSFDVISPLVNSSCRWLAIDPVEPRLYIATAGGISVFNYPEPPPAPMPIARSYVYPNPVYGRLGQNDLFIGDVTEAVVVEIYNAEGQLVHSTPSGETVVAGDVIWDLTDQSGFLVSSGVYFVRVISASDGSAAIKPVSIIR